MRGVNRLRTRRDANEPEVVQALRSVGARVRQMDKPLDLLVGFRGAWYWIEVKDGKKPPSERKLTDEEAEFLEICRADGLPAFVVMEPMEALRAIGAVS